MHPMISNNKFYWNIDQSVGKNASNGNQTDICYIQWFFVKAAEHPAHVAPDHLAVYRAVRVTGACNGTDNDPLVAAILMWQKSRNQHGDPTTVDGHVSVAHGGIIYAPHSPFLVVVCAVGMAEWFPNAFPRLDLIPGCPPSVAMAVRQVFL